jgi:membrane-associated phospholipid phosphatase
MSKQLKHRNKIIPTIARAIPTLIPSIALLNCMLDPSYNSFYVLSLSLFSSVFNSFLKNAVMKPIYSLSGRKDIPVLGLGGRPKNAVSCDVSLDGKPTTSFGMPSGHSQLVWTIGTYLLCRIIMNFIDNHPDNKVIEIFDYIWFAISLLLITACMIYVSYSRVYIEGCHTVQQVIFGSLIGIASGLMAYFFQDKIINAIRF